MLKNIQIKIKIFTTGKSDSKIKIRVSKKLVRIDFNRKSAAQKAGSIATLDGNANSLPEGQPSDHVKRQPNAWKYRESLGEHSDPTADVVNMLSFFDKSM